MIQKLNSMGEIADTKENYKKYLGDGTYVEFNGYHIVLTTSNGITNINTIALEPDVFEALVKYEKQLTDILIAEKELQVLKERKKQKDNG